MEKILKAFSHFTIRDYKGGKEIRVTNLDESVQKAQKIISKENLNVEIFDRDPILRSFSVREK